MNQTMTVREQVSALADGQLQGDALARALDGLCSDGESRAAWQDFHLVGDMLRPGSTAACTDSNAFLSRFQQRLAAEPVVLRPAVAKPEVAAQPVERRAEAANEPVFRWKLVAGAASLVAVAAIGFSWVGNGVVNAPAGAQLAQQQSGSGAVLASAEPGGGTVSALAPTRVVVGSGKPQVMLRDPRLDQLLEAHQQAGGASQMPSGFLRNATFEGPTR